MPTFGSLFAGIGGFDLGLERAGWTPAWQVELDPFCQRVLAHHWPDVRRHDDVRTFPPGDGDWSVDLICGGFPCQPVSHDGHQLGEQDERWLWPDFSRVVRLLRPRYVLLENVTGLLGRGLGSILSDLAALRYDAEWESIPAAAVGAPHRRERVFLVAYPDSERREAGEGVLVGDPVRRLDQATWRGLSRRGISGRVWLHPDGEVHGMADGLPDELVRLAAYGNAIVPQVAEWIGRRLLTAMTLARVGEGAG